MMWPELSDAASSASANALMENKDLWSAIGLGESSAETLAPQPHPVPELAPYFNDYMSKLKALNLPDSVLALLTHETLKTKIVLDKEAQDLKASMPLPLLFWSDFQCLESKNASIKLILSFWLTFGWHALE